MPNYKVKEKGFFAGKIYDPNGKRKTLHVEKAFNKVPAWLEEVKAKEVKAKEGPSREEIKGTLKAKGIEFNGNSKTEVLAKLLAEADTKEIETASFMGEGEQAGNNSTVETL